MKKELDSKGFSTYCNRYAKLFIVGVNQTVFINNIFVMTIEQIDTNSIVNIYYHIVNLITRWVHLPMKCVVRRLDMSEFWNVFQNCLIELSWCVCLIVSVYKNSNLRGHAPQTKIEHILFTISKSTLLWKISTRVGILACLRVIDPIFFLWTRKFQLKLTITRPLGRACIHNGVKISHGKSLTMSHFCPPNYPNKESMF